MKIKARTGMRQPMAAPSFRCRSDLVKGGANFPINPGLGPGDPQYPPSKKNIFFIIVSLPAVGPPGGQEYQDLI